jgi:hypothetical protein
MEPCEVPPPAGSDIGPELVKIYYCPQHKNAKFDPAEWRAKMDSKRKSVSLAFLCSFFSRCALLSR